MSRLSIPTVDQSVESTKPLLAAVNKPLGMVPNLMKLVGHSPAALEGYLSLNGALKVLTNYVNNVAPTDIDFPKVSARLAA